MAKPFQSKSGPAMAGAAGQPTTALIISLKQKKMKHYFRIESGTCIKGVFWPPLELRFTNFFQLVNRRITEVKYPSFYFTFTVAMVAKMTDEIGLK